MSSKWLNRLAKLDGAVDRNVNIHERVLRTGSPGVDFTFGNNWGLPLGFTQALFGPPKGGKSLYAYSMVAQMQRDDPEGIAIKIDTEFRDRGQLPPERAKAYGIDLNRYQALEINTPDGVFDQVEKDIAAMCQDGMPLRLLIIDSINGIMGRRMMNAETVNQQLIGDTAQTLGDGFKRILRVQRKFGFSVLLTAQVRAEMDLHEQQRGNKLKMAAAFGVQHYAEYFTFIERLKTKAGAVDELKREFVNKNLLDMNGNAERTAHKIRVTMKDSSLGPAGRQGIMTFDYSRGLVNQHEELFNLADKRGILETKGTWYTFGDFKGQKAALLQALETDKALAAAVQRRLMEQENNPAMAAMLISPTDESVEVAGDQD